MTTEIICGDALAVLPTLEPESFHACVTDSPYGLGFMGRHWDSPDNVAFRPETWAAVWRVLKPGAHLLAFGGTRTFHRLACAIEDAGFEIRDTIMWLYGSGFPKSLDVSKAIDRAAGAEPIDLGQSPNWRDSKRNREINGSMEVRGKNAGRITVPATEAARAWQGWGTALKPACEPIVVARKPLSEGTVAANVLRHGTGALNIEASRVAANQSDIESARVPQPSFNSPTGKTYNMKTGEGRNGDMFDMSSGRWPANVAHDGSPEVLAAFPQSGPPCGSAKQQDSEQSRIGMRIAASAGTNAAYVGDTGTAARFFKECPPDAEEQKGRWPANVAHDGSPEVLDAFARFGESKSVGGRIGNAGGGSVQNLPIGQFEAGDPGFGDTGTAARFFFCAKADTSERVGNHPTVKPVALMEWLVGLVTPPGGRVLDPFCGTGSTLVACDRLEFDAVGIEQDAQTVADAHEKLKRMRARRMIGDAEKRAPAAGQLDLGL